MASWEQTHISLEPYEAKTYHEIQKANISSYIFKIFFALRSQKYFSLDFLEISPPLSAAEMLGMFCSSHVIDLWACFENDFDKCEP